MSTLLHDEDEAALMARVNSMLAEAAGPIEGAMHSAVDLGQTVLHHISTLKSTGTKK